jgi:hypothetical protein
MLTEEEEKEEECMKKEGGKQKDLVYKERGRK